MSALQLVVVAAFLAVGLVPVLLLRTDGTGAAGAGIAPPLIPTAVVQNASTAYSLRMAAFVPLLVWGAGGDVWPAIVAAGFCGLGLFMTALLRERIRAFVAVGEAGSITVPQFIARQCGGGLLVATVAASLTVIALLGLVGLEAVAVTAFLKPLWPESSAISWLAISALLVMTLLYTVPSGPLGAMYSAQALLGVLYLALFGSTAFLLYLHASDLRPMPPYGAFAVLFIAAVCIAMLVYRRTRYADTAPLPLPAGTASRRALRIDKLFRKGLNILNACISVFAVIIVVIVGMEIVLLGLPDIATSAGRALIPQTKLSAGALVAIALVCLLQPISDAANWQRIAAGAQGLPTGQGETDLQWGKAFRLWASEVPLIWLFMAMLGALAAIATELPDDSPVIPGLVGQLLVFDNEITDAALALLLLAVLAIALSTMSSAFSAAVCSIRNDIMPFRNTVDQERGGTRIAIVVAALVMAGTAAALAMADATVQFGANLGSFLIVALGFFCVQLAMAPFIVGALLGRMSQLPPRAVAVALGTGAACGIGAVTMYAVTRADPWLWLAVPVALAPGLALTVAARMRAGGRAIARE